MGLLSCVEYSVEHHPKVKSMSKEKSLALALALAALLLAGCSAFHAGKASSSQAEIRNTALVALWTVEPAVRITEMEAEGPGKLPRSLVVSAEGSIYMVARQSMVFARDLRLVPAVQRNVLCVIAKNRERHRMFQTSPKLYDDALMEHLKWVHEQTSPSNVGSATSEFATPCILPNVGEK
jgi:hypothetical protein